MKTPRKRTRFGLCLMLANAPTMTGCFAISQYQNARITEPGPARPTFAGSVMRASDEPDEPGLYVFDMKIRKAVAPRRADVGFNASVITPGGGALVTLGVAPRVAVVDGWFAVDCPVNYIVGAPLPWGITLLPGAVATLPLSRQVEVNAGAHALVVAAGEGGETSVPVYSIGLGISDDLRRWAIRPEVAIMRPWDADVTEPWIVQFGVGIEPPVDPTPARN